MRKCLGAITIHKLIQLSLIPDQTNSDQLHTPDVHISSGKHVNNTSFKLLKTATSWTHNWPSAVSSFPSITTSADHRQQLFTNKGSEFRLRSSLQAYILTINHRQKQRETTTPIYGIVIHMNMISTKDTGVRIEAINYKLYKVYIIYNI